MKNLLKRLHQRKETRLEVQLEIMNRKSGKRSGNSIDGTMINVSHGGCCIMLGSPMSRGRHFFYATLNSDKLCISITIHNSDKEENIFAAIPIWMDSFRQEGQQYFKIGMKFIEPQDNLTLFTQPSSEAP